MDEQVPRTLATELTRLGHPVTAVTVARLLHDLDYSLMSFRCLDELSILFLSRPLA